MSTIYGLREKLINLRNSFRGIKGGLGNITATTTAEKEWLEWARDNSDYYREELNSTIEYVDKLIGNK
ncbi:MAG: hypothetical protein JJE15_13145 [Desulfobacteraceae bacterium]|nr:hypothetical protein [Desulfobacteraceae bacterium]